MDGGRGGQMSVEKGGQHSAIRPLHQPLTARLPHLASLFAGPAALGANL